METTTRKKAAVSPFTKCWNMAKKLDSNQKLELMTLLIESIKPSAAKTEPLKKKGKPDIDDFYGIWSDEEYRDAEDICNFIREGRHVQSYTDKKWNEIF